MRLQLHVKRFHRGITQKVITNENCRCLKRCQIVRAAAKYQFGRHGRECAPHPASMESTRAAFTSNSPLPTHKAELLSGVLPPLRRNRSGADCGRRHAEYCRRRVAGQTRLKPARGIPSAGKNRVRRPDQLMADMQARRQPSRSRF